MARPQLNVPFSAAPAAAYDPYLDLGRLLSRLEQNILRADGDRWRRLVGDEFQRMQARFDVAAARSLLVRVEQDALVAKPMARRVEMQGALDRRRVLVERLQERLDDLDEEARVAQARDDDDDEGDSSWESTDDVLARVIRTPSESVDSGGGSGRQSTMGESEADRGDEGKAARPAGKKIRKVRRTRKPAATAMATATATATATSTATPTATPTPTTAPPTMRARKGAQPPSGVSSSAEAVKGQLEPVKGQLEPTTAALKNALLSDAADASEKTNVAGEEILLDHHRREQETLSEDILRLAQALKERSLTTSRLLEDDKDVVDRVGETLHKTDAHLSAASRSMALLTRMTEGKGWWGRMLLFAMVYGLMLVLLLLFLFLPKLRL